MAIYNKRTTAKLDKLHGVMTEMKKLKVQEAKLKGELLVAFKEDDIDTLQMDYGTFYTKETPKWTFSEAVAKLTDKLKAKKTKEQEDGTAKKTVSLSLGFRAVK